MLINDYFSSKEQNKKILVVSDLGKGHELVRKYEAKTGDLVRNVLCMTIHQLTEAVNMYIQSEKEFTVQNTVLEQVEAMMLFRSVIFRNIKSLKFFNNEKMLDLTTTNEIFSKANLIRSNGWNGEEENSENDRISDLKTIVSEYEMRLEAEKVFDEISLLKNVIAEMKKWKNLDTELKSIFSADISYLKEDMDKLTGLQKEFLSLILNGQDSVVEMYEDTPSAKMLDTCKSRAEFFRGYGSFNEASYIVNDILSNKVPFGNVAILYSSPAQLVSIKAAIQGNGLSANFLSDYSAQNNAYISLARRVIAWANDDFSEKYLERILSSPVIFVENPETKKNVLASQQYFDHVLEKANNDDVLGWGYKRNIDFVNRQSEVASTESLKAVLKLHKELMDIFGVNGEPYDDTNKVRPIEIYEKLVQFIEKNTSANEERSLGLEMIKKLSGAISLEDRALTLREGLAFVDELLSTITVKDCVSADEIAVQCISGEWILVNRPNLYVIGLSLKDMQVSATESPVLSDYEMEKYLGVGYKPTVKRMADLKETNFYRTLGTFDGERIVFGYSSYDTVGLCESNPSSFFREALRTLKGVEINKLPEFVYGNPTSPVYIASPIGLAPKANYNIGYKSSNSRLEVLLDCPQKYYYSEMSKIPENTYTECNYAQWLDVRLTGTFFHEIVEKYVNQMLIKPATESYTATPDKELIEAIAETVKKKMLTKIPVAFEKLAARETNNLINVAESYLKRLHESLTTSGWRALFTEIKFKNSTYTVKDYNMRQHDFILSGTIDRIDYQVDYSARKILLRIIDYKTGKKASKEEQNDLGKLLQYAVYEKALMETGHYIDDNGNDNMLLDIIKAKISELESIEKMEDWVYEFKSFNYVFPMENKDFDPITICKNEIEGINITRLKCILTALQDKQTYPDHIELYAIVKEYATKYAALDENLVTLSANMDHKNKAGDITGISKNETDHCKYCEYGDVCEHRKAGEIQ